MSTPETQDQLVPTAGQTIGPFYGFALPYERGHELVLPGTPGMVRLHGTVLDGAGVPVPDAMLEIRQADPAGHVAVFRDKLARWSSWVERGASADEFVAAAAEELAAEGADRALYERAGPTVSSYAGLVRYWQKRREAAA